MSEEPSVEPGEWLLKALFRETFGYTPQRPEGAEEVDVAGLRVSTVRIDDMPSGSFETAIVDADGTIPVERYKTEDEARQGHWRWVEKAPTLTVVTKLGTEDGIVSDSIRTLRRRP